MTAIPAWPPKSLPRLFVGGPLSERSEILLDSNQSHYLTHVLRLGLGGELLLFDGYSGEWLARIVESAKKRVMLTLEHRTRECELIADVWLAFAPLKRTQTDWLVQKATELGAARIIPVMTRRTVAERVRVDRLAAIAIEAAEQCGRTRLPEVDEPVSLGKLLAERNSDRRLYFADELGGAAACRTVESGPALILIGPEGGFTPDERTLVLEVPNAVSISLGPRILRAETAAVAALAIYMAIAGDWQNDDP